MAVQYTKQSICQKKTDAFYILSSVSDHHQLVEQFFLGLIAAAISAHTITTCIRTACVPHAAIIAIASAVHAATVTHRHIVVVVTRSRARIAFLKHTDRRLHRLDAMSDFINHFEITS